MGDVLRYLLASVTASALVLVAGTSMAASSNKVLADRHTDAGAQCTACHESAQPAKDAYVESDRCLSCHGSRAKIAEKQAAMGKRNPHDNHLGDIDCVLCHAGHRKGESYCANCHKDFSLNVP